MTPRLKQRYKEQIAPTLMKEFGQGNPMAVPRLEKIVVNMGLGRDYIATNNAKVFDVASDELSSITGQKPVITKAKKSIAASRSSTTIATLSSRLTPIYSAY